MTFLPAEALRTGPSEYRVLFDSAPEPLLVLDPADGTALDANSAAARRRRSAARRPAG